jgi:hypothetical protein
LAEKPQTFIPILVDIDIKIEYTESNDVNRLYTDYQLENIVRNYQDVLKTILHECKNEHLYCFVLEKPVYRIEANGKEYTKGGFHLHFPYTFITKFDHENHLLPRVKKNVNKDQTFKSLGFEKSGDLIDNGYTKAPWLLYGSKKKEGMNPYKLTKIYNEERDIISIEEALKNYKIYNSDELEMDIKDMDALFGKTPHSVSQVQDSGPGSPYINLVNFTIPGDTFPNRCLTKENLINVFTKKNFPEAYIILAKKGQYNQDCMVQKALYIDKSITQEQVRQNYKAVGL